MGRPLGADRVRFDTLLRKNLLYARKVAAYRPYKVQCKYRLHPRRPRDRDPHVGSTRTQSRTQG